MTTYNTGNPIGSKDPRDLYDNAENFDHAINDDEQVFIDRLGVQRTTLWQMLEYSKQFNDRGDWASGTPYARRDYFTAGGITYVTLEPHTSTSIAADLAAGNIAVFSGNSGAMDFLQAGTSAVKRSAESKLRDMVSVKDFGAVGNGIADDTPAIQAAINSLLSGGTLFFPAGSYRITTSISATFGKGVQFNIVGHGAKIDGTESTVKTLISLKGSQGASSLLSASPAKNAVAITTVSSIGAVQGDVILITSTDLFNPTRAYYYKGEFIVVTSVAGNTYKTSNALYDSYINSNTTAFMLNMPTIVIEGLEITRNGNNTAISMEYVLNPAVIGCKIHGARENGIQLWYCYGGNIARNYIADCWYSGTASSYGFIAASCQGTTIQSNVIIECRHALTTGGNEPCRVITYLNNYCLTHPDEPSTGAIDTHGNSEACHIYGNYANGASFSGKNLSIVGNEFKLNKVNGYCLQIYAEMNSDFFLVRDNIGYGGVSSTGTGIMFSFPVSDVELDNIMVAGNHFDVVAQAITFYQGSPATTNIKIKKINMIGNYFCSEVAAAFGNVTTTLKIAELITSNNIFNSKTNRAITTLPIGTIALHQSTSDVYLSNHSGNYSARFAADNIKLIAPVFEADYGGAGIGYGVSYAATDKIIVMNPTYKNMTNKAIIESGEIYIENGWLSPTPVIINTAGAKLLSYVGTHNNSISYGDAAPTTKAWYVGDRVYKKTPAVGQPKSWVCTVAGTPGTWVSEGVL